MTYAKATNIRSQTEDFWSLISSNDPQATG